MVIYDQLRISDDGQSMFINAHVNKATYFKDVYLKKITICTEDQVNEINPYSYGEDFIYQANISALSSSEYQQVFPKVQVISNPSIMEVVNDYNGIKRSFTTEGQVDESAVSLIFSAKFSVLDGQYAPKLVVATNDFNPTENSPFNNDVFFTIDGTKLEKDGHAVWQFNGKGSLGKGSVFNLYLYKQVGQDEFEYIRMDQTDDFNFMHLYWQAYVKHASTTQRELNLVLDKNSFNEKFLKSDLSSNMFFVYIECDGIVPADTPCRLDEMTSLGVTFDYGLVFNQAMNYTKELSDDCNVPHAFIDFILNYDALKLAVETEHYVPAIQYWKNMMGEKGVSGKSIGITKPCGCHG